MELLFNVNNQTITRADQATVVADSKNYLKARFIFMSTDWDDVTKTAVFQKDNKVFNVLLTDNECSVPHEILTTGIFTVSVFGGNLITTGTVQVKVIASGYSIGVASTPPTTGVYEQLTATLATITATLEDLTDAVESLTERVEALEGGE